MFPKKDLIFEADSAMIYQPRYADTAKSRIKAIVRGADGSLREFEEPTGAGRAASALLRDIFAQYSEEEIEYFTERERRALEIKEALARQVAQDAQIAQEREVTFQAKQMALEVPAVLNCPDRRIPRQIRRARSAIEIAGWVALALRISLDESAESAVEAEPVEV